MLCQQVFYFLCIDNLSPTHIYIYICVGDIDMANYNQNQFKKGLMPLLLLKLLGERDMYGYELVKTIAERTQGGITIKEGAMYPVLYQMLEDGQVSERRVPYKKRMTHIYYHLEQPGRQLLEELTQGYYATTKAMMTFLESEGSQDE